MASARAWQRKTVAVFWLPVVQKAASVFARKKYYGPGKAVRNTNKNTMKMIGRFKKRPEFLRVNKEGRKWVSKSLILQAAIAGASKPRFGLIVTKKVSKSAVTRNRIRRRLCAAAYDVLTQHADPAHDYVLIGRAETEKCSYDDIIKDLRWCLKKMELYHNDQSAA